MPATVSDVIVFFGRLKTGGLTRLVISLLLTVIPLTGMARSAPGFTLPSLGTEAAVSLHEFEGKVVYVDFWASWCGPCRQSLPLYERLNAELPAASFQLIAINLDENREDAMRFLARYPVSYTVVFDPEAGSASSWGIRVMPTSFLLDAQGNIVREWAGFKPSHIQEIEHEIRALLE